MLKRTKDLPPLYSHGGTSYPYPAIPTKGQEDGIKPTNQSKTLPKELKRVIKRQTVVHKNTKETVGHAHTQVQQHETNTLSIMTHRQTDIDL